LKDFGTPDSLAFRVEAVEKSKEGVTEVSIIRAEDAMPASQGFPAYLVEYIVDSTRGKNHYLVKTTIVNKKLFVFTIQAPDSEYNSLSTESQEMLNSLFIPNPS